MRSSAFRLRRALPRRYYDRITWTLSEAFQSAPVRKATACLVIFLVISLISRVPLAPARWLTGVCRRVLTSEIEVEEIASRVRQIAGRFAPVAEGLTGGLAGAWLRASAGQGTLRMSWPVEGRLVELYGWSVDPQTKKERLHEGIDISAQQGTPIRAALAGIVVNVRDSVAYGKVVEVDHGRGLRTIYCHCSEITVMPNERVEKGQTIARVGMTGNATSPHLHFEVLVEGERVDPLKYLPAL